MGEPPRIFETMARIITLAGAPEHAARAALLRKAFEERCGAFSPDDPWFEERSRAFWCDAVTRGRIGRVIEGHLSQEEAKWLRPLERGHRGLFRAEGAILVDVWSGVELAPTTVDDGSQAELDAAEGQLFDGWVIGATDRFTVALLPGAIFHSRQATAAIESVLTSARALGLSTHATLDALLRMERTLRSLSRVKPEYAYRSDGLHPAPARPTVRAPSKGLT